MAEQSLTVLQILPALDSGGVERGTLELAAELTRRGHRSIVISAGGRMVEALVRDGSEHIAWSIGKKSLFTLRYVYRLRRFLENNQIDIIHVRSRLPAWVVWLAWRGMPEDNRPRFVTTVHGLYSVSRYSRIMTRGERVVAVSETIRNYILENYPDTDPGKIELIYRGVDRAEFPYGFRPDKKWIKSWYQQYPRLEGKQVLTLPGRLTRLKGHTDFINLIGDLKARGLGIHGLIVGGEDKHHKAYASELRNKVSSFGLAGDITFTGYRGDVREIYASSDIVFSLSTRPESFGRTALEALSLGTAVFGFNQGGIAEILAEIFPQGLLPISGREGIANKVEAYLRSPATVPDKKSFTLQGMLDQTIDLYIRLLKISD